MFLGVSVKTSLEDWELDPQSDGQVLAMWVAPSNKLEAKENEKTEGGEACMHAPPVLSRSFVLLSGNRLLQQLSRGLSGLPAVSLVSPPPRPEAFNLWTNSYHSLGSPAWREHSVSHNPISPLFVTVTECVLPTLRKSTHPGFLFLYLENHTYFCISISSTSEVLLHPRPLHQT